MKFLRALGWAYLLALHALLAFVLVKSDVVDRVQAKLAGPRPPEEGGRSWQNAVALQRQVDAQVPVGSTLFFGASLVHRMYVGPFGQTAVNFGVPFDTTATLLKRLPQYRSLASASAVVVLVGSNDPQYREPAATAANHRAILDALKHVPTVVAVGLPPVEERTGAGGALPARTNEKLKAINKALAESCAARPNCRYADTWPSLADPGDSLPARYHIGDGVHLNAAGYAEVTQLIRAALRRTR